MKILFVTDRRVNAGSIQAVASYVRAGDELGHAIAVYGPPDPSFPGVRFSIELSDVDQVVFVFESSLRWLSGLQLVRILSSVPRHRRAILDADGMYNRRIAIDGYDRNHASERERSEWLAYYERLADRILQPTFAPLEPGVRPLLFYGFDPAAQVGGDASRRKRFDLLHVGHNWWRWREVSDSLLPAIERVRDRVDGVCFVGSWWDAAPSWASGLGLQDAFGVDPSRMRRLGIHILPPIPFSEVIATMSMGRVNLMTQRPLFRHLRFLTSKYFEIFCADTIPLVMIDPDHAQAVYGPAGRELALHDRVADKLLDALTQPKKHHEIVQEVRSHLATHHSFRQRVQELVAALQA
jgi:hypothetical protein